MDRFIPVDTFRPFATILTDADGRVTYCNSKATSLLRCRTGRILGQRCWESVRLLDADGEPFCKPLCPVQQVAMRGELPPRRRVLCVSDGREPFELEMLTFIVPPKRKKRQAILHVLLTDHQVGEELASCDEVVERLSRLTSREQEVLEMLAGGVGTSAIASKLFISVTTVRNHVQHILAKLGVHGRLEAILALLHRREQEPLKKAAK